MAGRGPKFDAKAIAEACRSRPWPEVQEEVGCSRATLTFACKQYGVPMIGASVASARIVKEHMEKHPGSTIADIAIATGISRARVKYLCEHYNLSEPAKAPVGLASASTFEILALLMRGFGQSEIATEFFVSRQRVDQIKAAATKAGILVDGKPAITEKASAI